MPAVPRFQIGELVTVRRGTRDPDFPDIPLGGWTGRVREFGELAPEPHYLVAWNDFTLANIDPVYLQRCERDDLEVETMWLRESDLDPAPSQQPALEQPDRLEPRPLRLDHPVDRIRAAFGLSSDDPLPDVDLQSLRRYHAYLSERLRFPLAAEFVDEEAGFAAPPLPVQILRLWPVEDLDPDLGLQAEVREGNQVFLVPLDCLVVRGNGQAMILIQDYTAWYVDWADQQDDLDDEELQQMATSTLIWSAVRWMVYGAGCGASIGAVLAAVEQAQFGFFIGAFLLGALGYLTGAKLGGVFDPATGTIRRTLLGTFIATFFGVILGGVLGILLVAAIGTILGSIAFNLLGSSLRHFRVRVLSTFAWSILGAFAGALIYALILDREAATTGALIGAAVGGGGVFVLLLLSLAALALFGPQQEPPE